jgi:hypothetical protein
MKQLLGLLVLTFFATLAFGATQADARLYSKTKCYTYEENGVDQWKHCASFQYDWLLAKMKCTKWPTGTFTRFQPGWSSKLYEKGCEYPTYTSNGYAWHAFLVYKNGVLKGTSDIDAQVQNNDTKTGIKWTFHWSY